MATVSEMVKLRVATGVVDGWRVAAEGCGVSLSEWIRGACDVALGVEPVGVSEVVRRVPVASGAVVVDKPVPEFALNGGCPAFAPFGSVCRYCGKRHR